MKHYLFTAALAVAALFAPMALPAYASDASVLACRATEGAKVLAGECGAHGCDCGLLCKECKAAKRYLKSFDREGRKGMNYVREAAAYASDCGKDKP